MGLFGIHMPTIYGEGRHAFIRLQEEILKNIPDQSIFLWTRTEPSVAMAFTLATGRPTLLRWSTLKQVLGP